jgi:hypothetical protein
MDFRTDVWAAALIRRAELGGAAAFVVRKGDAERGAVLVKVSTLDGRARLYEPALGPDGGDVFLDLSHGVEGDADAAVEEMIAARVRYDPDLWVIEIEDRDGRHFLTEKVETR